MLQGELRLANVRGMGIIPEAISCCGQLVNENASAGLLGRHRDHS
jgi:hypothetical protein